jgi:hypothetical protein|tara:strand:+ start:394 stop:561 length:168 start_codon:yes stop_codon:yes gene_type:complete
MSKEQKRLEKWEAINDLADKHFDAAIKRGEAFTEGLSNWAMDKAVMEIGNLQGVQ